MAGDEDTLLDSTEEPARGRNEEQEQHRASRLLLPRRVVSPIRGIALRLGVALSCLVITTALVWFGRDGYTDSADGEVSLLDALYYATVTLSTTGYGDISPVSDSARLINVLIITPLRFLFLIVLVGTVLETLAERTRLEWRQQKWKEKKMDGHTVVVGFGVKGRAAAQAMVDAGSSPDRVVVITPDAESASDARRMGIAVVLGDARREEVLLDAGVDRASSIIVATDSDDTSVLVTLTVKRLMPATAKIVSAARESANAQVLRDSGAQGVIVTAEAAGRLLALQLQSPHAGDLMEDLLDSSRGLELIEREVGRQELGISPMELEKAGEIVLAVIRQGRLIRFDENAIRTFNKGDRVVVVRQRPRWEGPAPHPLA